MADASNDLVQRPFTTFNFRVEISLPDQDNLCNAAFSECGGLEVSMSPTTIREGGNNNRPIHLTGPLTYGQLSLKRGMTASFDLWKWFERFSQPGNGGLRAEIHVTMLAADGETEQVGFKLTGCVPTKLVVPPLNAADGLVAVEEMQIAYETLSLAT